MTMAMNQRIRSFRKLVPGTLLMAAAALLFNSCGKEAATLPDPGHGAAVTDAQEQRQIKDLARKLPSVGIYNRTMDRILVFTRQQSGSRGFSFTSVPANGINFATSNGGQWVWTEQGGMAVLTEPSAGLGGGGGLVAAGNTTLDINIAVCFAVGEDAMGDGLFGPDMGNVAGVIGISGDIDALVNGDFSDGESDPFQFFHGFAYYFVYADQLSDASYEVLDWISDLDQPENELQDFSFAFVISFQNEGGIYLSRDGSISVNGGTMQFNGNYFAVEGTGFFDDEGDEDASYTVVPGYGAMGCQ